MSEHTYTVPDGPKMLRETLAVAQARIGQTDEPRKRDHLDRLQRLINECDRKRPLGPDGKHDDRHTSECGCEETMSGADVVPRCQYVTPTPWGLAQCVLPEGHEERHAYSPSEALEGPR